MNHPTDELKQAIKTYFSSLLEELHNHMEPTNKVEVFRSFLSLVLSAYRLRRLLQLESHRLAEHLTQMHRNDDGSLDINSLLKSWEENLRESAFWNAAEEILYSHKTFQEFCLAVFEQDANSLSKSWEENLRESAFWNATQKLLRVIFEQDTDTLFYLCDILIRLECAVHHLIIDNYISAGAIIQDYERRVGRKKKERYLQRLYIPPNANRLCLDSTSSDAIATLSLVNNVVRKRSSCTHHRITTSLSKHHPIAKKQKCERLHSTQ